MRADAQRIRLVLLRPRTAENLGAAARAMKNFGLDDWVWVDPQVEHLEPAHRLAVHAAELLSAVQLAPSLEAAVADCVWVVGTTSRQIAGKRRLLPGAAARELVERAALGRVALVFGDERHGLTNAEVAQCHALSAAPTSTAQPSLNLAQAVLLYSYELRMARLTAAPGPSAPLPIAATTTDIGQLEAVLRATLERGGFLRGAERHALRDVIAPLIRSRLTRREVRLWLAALHTLLARFQRTA